MRAHLVGLMLTLFGAGCISEPDYAGRLCSAAEPCPDGFSCATDGRCAPGDAPRDGGLGPDGGTDATVPDAGAPDSGPRDAGARDAELVDAGDPRQARCGEPIGYPSRGWQARYFTLDGTGFGACLGVDDVAGDDLDVFVGSTEGPAPDVVDFGAIWSAARTFSRGVHTAVIDHDDGVRVFLDGQLLYEDWTHGRKTQVAFQTPYLDPGDHQIRIEHYDDNGEAVLRFSRERGCTRLAPPSRGWTVAYYEVTATDEIEYEECFGVEILEGLDLDHGFTAPAVVLANGGDVDDFGVVAVSAVELGGEMRFDLLFDDGLRLFADGVPIFEEWEDGASRSRRAYHSAVGPTILRVEKYDEAGSSRLRVQFDTVCNLPPSNLVDIWFAAYYPVAYDPMGPTWALDMSNCLGAEEISSRTLAWTTRPNLVTAAGFTERWGAVYRSNRTFSLSAQIDVTHDDGLRVYSGSSALYESWTAPQVVTSDFVMPPGNHDLRVEYFENLGGEQLRLTW